MTARHIVAALRVSFGAWLWVAHVALAVLASSRKRNFSMVWFVGGVSAAIGLAAWPGLDWRWAAAPLVIDPGALIVFGIARQP